MNVLIIAIDGPAASGKTTIAALLAERLNYNMLDSGSMYRAVALLVIEGGAAPDDEKEAVKAAEDVAGGIMFVSSGEGDFRLYIGERDVTVDIRSQEVTEAVSPVSKLAGVRALMVQSQKRIAGADAVVEGRDIGTVVFPDAGEKFYLDAALEERAKRRYLEEKQKGTEQSLEKVMVAIKKRDEIDSSRDLSPLARAEDAVYIDTTGRGIDEVVDEIMDRIEERL
ncbi:MAG: (d)CMP kinase [Actinobacteria bacterium]|nr:(d)CMP kinase [Actinomycetota bacterium]